MSEKCTTEQGKRTVARRGNWALGVVMALTALPVLGACLRSLPRPPTRAPSPDDATLEVPYPPPPARVETVPAKPGDGVVWVDGQWDWDGRDYRWLGGAWVKPIPSGFFVPWITKRREDGRLFFARAGWHAADGKVIEFGTGANGDDVAETPADDAAKAKTTPKAAPPVTAPQIGGSGSATASAPAGTADPGKTYGDNPK